MANLNEILKMDKKTNDIGIYKLTPVEAFLINKNLPYGIKLITDTEYNRKYNWNVDHLHEKGVPPHQREEITDF